MDPKQQLEEIKARSNILAGVAARACQGGFIVNGNIQYIDKDTAGVLASRNDEAVAGTAQQVSQMVLNYLTYQSFDAPAQATLSAVPQTAPAAI